MRAVVEGWRHYGHIVLTEYSATSFGYNIGDRGQAGAGSDFKVAQLIVKVKGKGKGKRIYIALIFVVHARRSGMDHTVLPANTPMLVFTS